LASVSRATSTADRAVLAVKNAARRFRSVFSAVAFSLRSWASALAWAESRRFEVWPKS
jgi:hypothetical protein